MLSAIHTRIFPKMLTRSTFYGHFLEKESGFGFLFSGIFWKIPLFGPKWRPWGKKSMEYRSIHKKTFLMDI